MKTQLLATMGLVVLAGCGTETTSPPSGARDFFTEEGNLHYTTPRGEVVIGERVPNEEAVRFEISHEGEVFGFELGTTYFAEWADDEEVRIDYTDPVQYTVNGTTYPVPREDVPQWSMAKARAGGGETLPPSLGVPTENLKVMDNPLADRLLEVLGDVNNALVTEDGRNCSSEFMMALSACMRWKCPFGGLSNVGCNACTVTWSTCVIIAVYHGFSN